MLKKTRLLIIILLLTTGGGMLWGFIKGKEAEKWRADWQAVKTELEQAGFTEMETGDPVIEDLPEGALAGGVIEGEAVPTESVEVHGPVTIVKHKPCEPCPDCGQPLDTVVTDLRDKLALARLTLLGCPKEPWLLLSGITPESIGARCRAEWAFAPGGDLFARLKGQGSIKVGDTLLHGKWQELPPTETVAAPSAELPTKQWVLWAGFHLERFKSSVSSSGDDFSFSESVDDWQLSPELGAAWWRAKQDGLGHKRLGWVVSANGTSLDSLGVSSGLALTWH